ncbi:MAG: indolepyruvate ferredoxin oxidoreductase subunit alpha, partial [Synergistetes bacterium]|nr:indolepyruvate ferredoxin oxidoreductase subunit alpha [Synergistota bacterium]
MGVVLLGNEAVARGIVESGCQIATGYPGTPSSEILPAVENFNRQEGTNLVVRWSVNEKVAFEVAVSAAYTGKRAAVVMKQVGLNVAADPLMSSALTSIEGGFLIVVADDPGPYSSQTKQDTRFFGMFGRVPVLDPMDIPEAKKMVVE